MSDPDTRHHRLLCEVTAAAGNTSAHLAKAHMIVADQCQPQRADTEKLIDATQQIAEQLEHAARCLRRAAEQAMQDAVSEMMPTLQKELDALLAKEPTGSHSDREKVHLLHKRIALVSEYTTLRRETRRHSGLGSLPIEVIDQINRDAQRIEDIKLELVDTGLDVPGFDPTSMSHLQRKMMS